MNIENKEILPLIESINKLNKNIDFCGRVEQIYLIVDRTIKLLKEIYPESYCTTCPITCCMNDMYLPVSFVEWKVIENYINNKLDENHRNLIKTKLSNIDNELFTDINQGFKIIYRYKNIECPLLIDNKCSVKPFRPLRCRIYGLYRKSNKTRLSGDNFTSILNTCSLEISRWKNNHPEKLYLQSIEHINNTLININRGKESKLLLVWLSEYFKTNG